MTSSTKVKVPIFDGKNFASWKYRIQLVCQMNECNKTLTTNEKPAGVTEADWTKMKIKASNLIVFAVNNQQLELIKSINTPKEMLEKFANIYEQKSDSYRLT